MAVGGQVQAMAPQMPMPQVLRVKVLWRALAPLPVLRLWLADESLLKGGKG